MPSYNRVIVMGNAGKDAELRFTAKGEGLLTFSLAASEKRGESEHTEWFSCVMFGDRAEKLAPHVKKGSPYLVEGKLRTRNWEDDNGQRHYRTEVMVDRIEFVNSRKPAGNTRDVAPDDLPFD